MKRLLGLAMLAMVGVAGCGNDVGQNDMKSVLTGIKERGLKVGGATRAAPDVAKMLAGTTGPLRLVSFDLDKATAGLQQIESNGAYRTFATADRRTITFKHGMVTATRGLGNDLMSADVDGSLALIRGQQGGQAVRVMRFLDGENKVRALRFDCTIRAGAWGTTTQGEVTAKTRQMTEYCTSENRNFNASYAVTATGEIVQSHQWMSPARGMARITVLRR